MVIFKLLTDYIDRRDVVRAACRLLHNVCEYAGIIVALDKFQLLDKMLHCVGKYPDTKDILDSCTSIIKAYYKRMNPKLSLETKFQIDGLLTIFRGKLNDETLVMACSDTITKFINSRSSSTHAIPLLPVIPIHPTGNSSIYNQTKDATPDYKSPDGKSFEIEVNTFFFKIKPIKYLMFYVYTLINFVVIISIRY